MELGQLEQLVRLELDRRLELGLERQLGQLELELGYLELGLVLDQQLELE